jgi:hypothetical protein
MAECETAANQLNENFLKDPHLDNYQAITTKSMEISNTVPRDDGWDHSSRHPKGCYVYDGKLYFNAKMSNTGPCDSHLNTYRSQCICPSPPDWGLQGYDLSNVVETSLRVDDGSFNVTGIKCAAGYNGVPRALPCGADGEAYVASGCVKIKKCDTYRQYRAEKSSPFRRWHRCDTFVTSMAECETAANQLNENFLKDPDLDNFNSFTTTSMEISNTVPRDDGWDHSSHRPKGCYVYDGKLYFNAKMSNTGSCDSHLSRFIHDPYHSQCICPSPPDWGLQGYNLSNVVETSLRVDDGSFNVTGIKCAAGYNGVPRALPCGADGEAYVASGCVKIKKCKRGSYTLGCYYSSSSNNRTCDIGYDYSEAVENLITDASHNFSVTGLRCPAGYEGTPNVSVCAVDGEPYSVSGCKKIMNSCRSRLHREWSYQENTHWDRFQCHKYIETKEECEWAVKQLNLGYPFGGNGEYAWTQSGMGGSYPGWHYGNPAGKGCFTGPQASRLAAHTFYFRDPTVPPPTTRHSRIGDWADWDGWHSSFTNSLICLKPSRGFPLTPVGYTITSLAEKNLRTDQFNVGSFVKSTDTIFIFN